MTGVAALAFAATFTSCSKTDLYDENKVEEQKIASVTEKYDAAFKKYVGVEIDKNHTWGFGKTTTPATTRASDNANSNMWGSDYYVPSKLTPEQIDVVMKWFAKNQNPNGVTINCDKIFAQYVGATDNGKSHMDYMTVGDDDFHISNLNAGDQGTKNVFAGDLQGDPNLDFNLRKVYYDDKITFIEGTSTTRFGYHNSNDSKMYFDFVIIPGYEIDDIVADRYFVGFDYKQLKDDGTGIINLDGYFNDWVVAITPGIRKPNVRVICEDLSVKENGDFDFNDAVFDVEFTSTGARIVLLAAGGTLPLTIGGEEVHEKFGVPTSTMVNTGKAGRPIVEFNITGSFGYDANNIPVIVTKTEGQIPLTAVKAHAPGKIQVNQYYKWCTEREDILTKYPKFADYCADQNVKWY